MRLNLTKELSRYEKAKDRLTQSFAKRVSISVKALLSDVSNSTSAIKTLEEKRTEDNMSIMNAEAILNNLNK